VPDYAALRVHDRNNERRDERRWRDERKARSCGSFRVWPARVSGSSTWHDASGLTLDRRRGGCCHEVAVRLWCVPLHQRTVCLKRSSRTAAMASGRGIHAGGINSIDEGAYISDWSIRLSGHSPMCRDRSVRANITRFLNEALRECSGLR
jgi:hypothetical protein